MRITCSGHGFPLSGICYTGVHVLYKAEPILELSLGPGGLPVQS